MTTKKTPELIKNSDNQVGLNSCRMGPIGSRGVRLSDDAADFDLCDNPNLLSMLNVIKRT